MLTTLLFISGFVLLVLGAEWLVKGSARLATIWGLSPVLIGLTIVAFGTSAPELAISLFSAVRDQTDLTFGNVVGSNICNTLLILGLSATVAPLVVAQKLVRIDVPLMIGFSVMMALLASNEMISHTDGIILFGSALAYTYFTIKKSQPEDIVIEEEYAEEIERIQKEKNPSIGKQILLIILGLVLLALGAHWLVEGATVIARSLGVSELVIGLTIVAFGTSLPELATSVIAALRGHRDIAVGNIIGSNIMNIAFVLGLGSLVAPHGIPVAPAALYFDVPFMIATAIACLPIFFIGYKISRWEGLLFLAYYIGYITFLILKTVEHDSLPFLSSVSLTFIIPITGITLLILFVRELKKTPIKK